MDHEHEAGIDTSRKAHGQALQLQDHNIATLALNPSGNTRAAKVQLLQRLRCTTVIAHGGKMGNQTVVGHVNAQRRCTRIQVQRECTHSKAAYWSHCARSRRRRQLRVPYLLTTVIKTKGRWGVWGTVCEMSELKNK